MTRQKNIYPQASRFAVGPLSLMLLIVASSYLPALGQKNVSSNIEKPFFLFNLNPSNLFLQSDVSSEQTIFTTQIPASYKQDAIGWELGTRFKANTNGQVTKVRIYTNSAEGGIHTVRIWRRSTNTVISGPHTWDITRGTTGWKTFTLPTAANIIANVNYIVSISTSDDRFYGFTQGGFNSPINNGNLITYIGSGTYTEALGTMPTKRWNNSNYFRDIVFVPSNATPTPMPTPVPTPTPISTPIPTPVPTPTPIPTPVSTPTPTPVPTSTPTSTPVPNGQLWSQILPTTGSVVIPAGQIVILDTNVTLSSLQIDGTLVCADKDLNVSADWIMVHGLLQCGTSQKPYTNRLVITLTGDVTTENMMGMGYKFLGTMMGGVIEMQGEPRKGWTTLNATAKVGDTQITLAEKLNWRIGDKIVIASTSFYPNQAEVRTITGINGTLVTLNEPLKYNHYGELQQVAGQTLDERAEVGLLTRNILITSDAQADQTKFGGHIMIMDKGSNARIDGVELYRLGQLNRLGRYSFHWHLVGEAKGGYFNNSSVHDSIQRGVVVHGTNNVTVKGNVVYNTVGHAYMVEDGTETGNIFDGNLGLLAQSVNLTQPVLAPQNDNKAATYWIKSITNTFINNRSAGGYHAGFWFDDPSDGDVNRLIFSGNVAHSHINNQATAIWVASSWGEPYTLQNNVLWKNDIGSWAPNERRVKMVNSIIADNAEGVSTNHDVFDSLFIGRSANTANFTDFNAYRWGYAGIMEYNHYSQATNTTFVNFTDGRAGIRALRCSIERSYFKTQGIRYINATPVLFCGGDPVMEDVDGSISGTGKYTMIISQEAAMDPSGCTSKPEWGVNLCPQRYELQRLYVEREPRISMTATRDDGVVQDTWNAFPDHVLGIPGRTYTFSRGLSDMSKMNIFSWSNLSIPMRIVIPAPNDQFDVWRSNGSTCYNCTSLANKVDLRQQKLTAASSLSELHTSNGSKYYYDTGAKQLHVLVSGGMAVFVERK
jgi:hypothetical protein